MKVLYFYQYFSTPKGSWSTRVYEFARRWVKKGDEVTVVTCLYDRSDLKPQGMIYKSNVEGIDVRVINIKISNKHPFLFRIFTFLVYACIASWYALTLPADIIISSSGPITVGIPGLLGHYLRRKPFIFEVRDLWPQGAIELKILKNPIVINFARLLEKTCYRAASRIIVLSQGAADWIKREYGYHHIDVVTNVSDNELFSKKNESFTLPDWAKNKELVLYTGTIGMAEGCKQIIDMAEYLNAMEDHKIEIAMIGDGMERESLEQYARETKIQNIHFLRSLPKPEIVSWVQRAFCALIILKPIPCFDTSSPNKMFDAFAAGVPVIQTTKGWIKDLLERENCGLTVSQSDPKAMAESILKLSHNKPLRDKMQKNAKRIATEKFDVDYLSAKMHRYVSKAIYDV